jgi:hypothetical protein
MSTRSKIGILLSDGSVCGQYVHWDGYPEHNGAILVKDYTTRKQVSELIDLGDLSCLKTDRNWQGKQMELRPLAYSERGNQDTEPQKFDTVEEFYTSTRQCDGEFAYLFDQVTNTWSCYNVGSFEFVSLYPELSYA